MAPSGTQPRMLVTAMGGVVKTALAEPQLARSLGMTLEVPVMLLWSAPPHAASSVASVAVINAAMSVVTTTPVRRLGTPVAVLFPMNGKFRQFYPAAQTPTLDACSALS